MSVIRVHKTKNYTVMSNYHFKEKEMSLKAKGMLSLMLSLHDDWRYSISGLVALSKDGKDSVMSALSELEKFGYLARVKLTDSKGRFSGIEYNIFEEPQKEFTGMEKPISVKENMEKASTENQKLLITKELNDLDNKVLFDINNYTDILDTIEDDHLRNLYCYFLENRDRLNAPLTTKGLEMLMERVREIAGLNITKQKALLRSAVINNWKNVYPEGHEPKEDDELKSLKDFYS
jgi:hypothetical protein